MLLAWLLVQAAGPAPTPALQWTVLGLLAAVLGAVGVQVRVLLDRAEKRLVASDEERKAERERDLAMQERMIAALLESVDVGRQSTKLIERLEARLL